MNVYFVLLKQKLVDPPDITFLAIFVKFPEKKTRVRRVNPVIILVIYVDILLFSPFFMVYFNVEN